MNVIADAIAFKHELVPLSGPNFDDPIGESPFGHFSSECRKKRGTDKESLKVTSRFRFQTTAAVLPLRGIRI